MSSFNTRRDFLHIGGLGLCGVGLTDVLKANPSTAKAKHLIVCWIGGGPLPAYFAFFCSVPLCLCG